MKEYDPVLQACAKVLLEKEKINREEFEALFDAYSVNNADAQADGAAQTEANADGETAAEQPEEQA